MHFSHDHPLVLTNMTEAGHQCFGCKSAAAGWIYRCNPCNFDLHLSCSAIPLQIKHPFDIHPLTLLARPVYGGGIFKCDACGQESSGFPFHCSLCQTDLHPSCANLPLQFNHPNHSHTLGLSFTSPYPQKVFYCNVCSKPGKDSWQYHCAQCSFDAHVTCLNVTSQSNRNPNLSQPITASRSMNPASSPINSTVHTDPRHYMPTGIPQHPAGPYRPAMLSVPGQYVPTGISTGTASRSPIYHPAMFPPAANIPNTSQIRPPSYIPTFLDAFAEGAAQSLGSSLMNMALGNNTGSQ